MKDELITYETAVLAKEKGFNIECLHFYTKPRSKMFGIDEHGRSYPIKNKSKSLYVIGEHATLNIENVFYAPTQSLLSQYLRKKHNLYVLVEPTWRQNGWSYSIIDISTNNYHNIHDDFVDFYMESFEEAFEEGLQKALKLIKNKVEKLDCPYAVEINNVYGTCSCNGEDYQDCLNDI